MSSVSDDWRHLSFSELDREILRVIAHEQVVGARRIARVLAESVGWVVSESTVARRLSVLDYRDLTRPTGKRGRTVTATGRALVAAGESAARQLASIDRALTIESVRELEDLLRARRGVEGESAYLAARRRTDAEFRSLETTHRAVVDSVEGAAADGDESDHIHIEGLEFHRALCRLSENSILVTMAEMLFDERLNPLEEVLDMIAASLGTRDRALFDHAEILDAVGRRDGDGARAATEAHITHMLKNVQEFEAMAGTVLLSRVMRLASTASTAATPFPPLPPSGEETASP